MNEKTVVRLLRKNYPTIFDELTQRPELVDMKQVERMFRLFCQVKEVPADHVIKNRQQSRLLFITVVVKAYDPLFFVDHDKTLIRGLRERLANVLKCHETQISHTLATVRTYLKVYKSFRSDVVYIYNGLMKAITDELIMQRRVVDITKLKPSCKGNITEDKIALICRNIATNSNYLKYHPIICKLENESLVIVRRKSVYIAALRLNLDKVPIAILPNNFNTIIDDEQDE